MCGRFTLTHNAEQLAEELGVPVESLADYRPRYNIAPTDAHWIVRMKYEDREVLPARWGLVNAWAQDRKRAALQINARAETVRTNRAFRDAFQRRRCVVPADGFFEWVGAKATRRPVWFHRADGGLLLYAGLYESWQPAPGVWERTFTIITTDANAVVEPIHNRMPVILLNDAIDAWLHMREENPDKLLALLRPPPDDLLIATPVSPRANSVKHDDPGVLEEADQPELLVDA